MKEIFSFREDESSDLAFCQELSVYDKINYKSKAIVKISLYEDSGTLSKIRFVRSSGISEVDKIIAEDITRWKFDFTTHKIPELYSHFILYPFEKPSNKRASESRTSKNLLNKFCLVHRNMFQGCRDGSSCGIFFDDTPNLLSVWYSGLMLDHAQ